MEKQKRDGALDAIEWRILKNLLLLVFAYALGVMMSIGMQKLDVMSYSAKTADKNKVAITFDDGPNPEYTVELLEGLQKRGVKATFFVLGAEVEKYPDIVKKIDDGGHLIGVHSYEHVNFGQIGDEAAIEQIEKTQEAIHNVTGKYAGYIRPPYGCWKKSLDVEVPLIEVLWDIDPLDWATKDADTVV